MTYLSNSKRPHWEKRTNDAVAEKVKKDGGVIIKVDGSCWTKRGSAGWAAVRVLSGERNYEVISQNAAGISSSNEAERLAIRDALRWVQSEAQDKYVVIHTDSRTVVDELMGSEKLLRRLKKTLGGDTCLWECRELLDELGSQVCVSWVPRKKVRPADLKAKRARKKWEEENF